MATVIDTPLRLFAELSTSGALTGKYQLEYQRRVEVDGKEVMAPVHNVRDLTPEEGAQIIGSQSAQLAAQLQAISAQFDGERAALAQKEAELSAQTQRAVAAEAKLTRIAQVNKEYDTMVNPLLVTE